MVEYNIRVGMKTEELYNELHGRTAGENQRERAILFQEWANTHDVKYKGDNRFKYAEPHLIPKVQIVMEYPGNYALALEYAVAETGICLGTDEARRMPLDNTTLNRRARLEELNKQEKLLTTEPESEGRQAKLDLIAKERSKISMTPIVKTGELLKRFYLIGINDEGMYFVRPLQEVPLDKIKSIDALLAWLNKTDLGYTKRIQGDIVIRFMEKNRDNLQYKHRLGETVGKALFLAKRSYRLPKNGNNKGFTDWYMPTSTSLRRELNFGDHRIKVIGRGRIALPHMSGMYAIEPLVVDAKKFKMTHSEHGELIVEVPAGHYAVLGSQRGRDEITGHGIFD